MNNIRQPLHVVLRNVPSNTTRISLTLRGARSLVQHRNFTVTSAQRSLNHNGSERRKYGRGAKVGAFLVTASVAYYVVAAYIWNSAKNMHHKSSERTLDDVRFSPFEIISKEPVSTSCSIYTLRALSQPKPAKASTKIPKSRRGEHGGLVVSQSEIDKMARSSAGTLQSLDTYATEWALGQWSVEFKQPQLQIAREYTPLPPISPDTVDLGNLRFLIRKEHKGEVSNYLDRLPVGSTIHVRGPKQEFHMPEIVEDVVFLAGGTSIAPALQMAHALLTRGEDEGFISGQSRNHRPKIHIMWANRRYEECAGAVPMRTTSSWLPFSSQPAASPATRTEKHPIVKDIEILKSRYPERFHIDYLVDEEGSYIDTAKIKAACASQIPMDGHSNNNQKFLMVSGPEGFITYLAGQKGLEPGAQGTIGGEIKKANLVGWRVWKL